MKNFPCKKPTTCFFLYHTAIIVQEMGPLLQQILHRCCVIWDAGGYYSEPQHMVSITVRGHMA